MWNNLENVINKLYGHFKSIGLEMQSLVISVQS